MFDLNFFKASRRCATALGQFRFQRGMGLNIRFDLEGNLKFGITASLAFLMILNM